MDSTGRKSFGIESANEVKQSSKAYTIGGVSIQFPYRAYPSQITMMDRIVKCLNHKSNCLLESPTGSGKSLALLCASLGWLKKTKKAILELEQKLDAEAYAAAIQAECDRVNDLENKANEDHAKELLATLKKECVVEPTNELSDEKDLKLSSTVARLKIKMQKKEQAKRGIVYIGADNKGDLEDFKPIKKFRSSIGPVAAKPSDQSLSESTILLKQESNCSIKTTIAANQENTKGCGSKCFNSPCGKAKSEKEADSESSTPIKVPTIYFGTRTHKQVAQIIRELKKTPYKDSPMTILSSRERTCIHPGALNSENKNEACEELLKAKGGPACHFYRQSKNISHSHPSHLSNAFDLEEFVNICRRARACPYYGARELLSASDIVFCPYNYLVDPLIRSAMSINLKGSIVVMDEAHNIEDSAREAASGSFSLSQLEASRSNLDEVAKTKKEKAEIYRSIAKILANLIKWMKSNAENLTDYTSFDSSTKVWAGDNMMAILNYIELGPDSFTDFKKTFEIILADESDKENPEEVNPLDMDELKLLGTTISCLKNLVQILTYLYKSDLIYVQDYRFCITKKKQQFGRRSLSQNPFELTLQFSCLNPAVAFSDLKDITHSVIVASGTLSPLASFESELGIPFKLTLEANHVVSSDKMWVGTVGRGPNNTCLSATYHVASTYDFQDDIGQLVFEVCNVIPYGVLCFLPSYGMLEKLTDRWQQTGIWDKLMSKKVVLSEPRKQGQFEEVINEFYGAVDNNDTSGGALMFAVCRGKVSEGLDFADNKARAVITIGIPFPNIKDAQVDLKRQYNNMHHAKRQLMNGSEWYETQAFRALNQALGRCIRHRDDFGALIIVDERFQRNKQYPNALSKWIRNRMEHFPSFPHALQSLNAFAERTGLKNALPKENLM